MDHLLFLPPNMDYADQLKAYLAESQEVDNQPKGISGLHLYPDIAEWLAFLKLKARKETCPEGFVPDETYMTVREKDNRLVGMINIRMELTDFLRDFGGHIGYGIRPDERGKGYAPRQLALALERCRQVGLNPVLLTCRTDNVRSRRTILRCGGQYEDTRTKPDGEQMERYWITISNPLTDTPQEGESC